MQVLQCISSVMNAQHRGTWFIPLLPLYQSATEMTLKPTGHVRPKLCCVLQVWDLKDLGLQASQRIAQAGDPLRLLTDISQNFPTLAASLSRLPANASLAAEVRSNQRSLPAGLLLFHLLLFLLLFLLLLLLLLLL